MLILGLDPGTIRTGYAIINVKENNFSIVKFGVFSASPRLSLEKRLLIIARDLEKLYGQYSVSDTAIEQIFFGKNPDSAFKLGQIFGICVYQAVSSGSQVFSYAARYIKQSVTGSGRADKKAVQAFVLNIFGVKMNKCVEDAADALAVALCHIYQKQNLNLQSLSSFVQMEAGSEK